MGRFQKGIAPNPKGSSKLSRARAAFKENIEELMENVLYAKRETLNAINKSPDSMNIEVLMASVIAQAIKKGDVGVLNSLLDRLIGKIPTEQHTELSYKIKKLEAIEQMDSKQILELLPEAVRTLEDKSDGSE